MIIKPFTKDMLDNLGPLAAWFFLNSPTYSVVTVNESRIVSTLARWIDSPDYFKMAAFDEEGMILGGFIGHKYRLWFADDLCATDDIHFLLPQARGKGVMTELVKKFEEWAMENGCSRVFFANSFGNDISSAKSLYERVGAKHVGFVYVKEIP